MEPPIQRPQDAKNKSDWRKGLQEAGPYVGLGMQLALTMVFFTGGGYLLDQWLETTPWLLVAGSFIGMVAVFIHLFRVASESNRKSRNRPKRP